DEEITHGRRHGAGGDDRCGRSSGIDDSNVGEATATDNNLWTFHKDTHCKLPTEVFHNAESILTRPGETNDILWIDDQEQDFAAILDSFTRLDNQAPHLTGGEAKAVIESCLSPNLPLPVNVAVTLAIVGGGTCAEEVAFVIAGKLGGANIGFR